MIAIPKKYGVVVQMCPPFPTQIYACKLPKIYGNMEMSAIRATFVVFCCHDNAKNLKLLLCFLSCWVY